MLKGAYKMKKLYKLLVPGKEKAVVGFFVSGILSALALIGISGDMTVKEALVVLVTVLVTAVSTGLSVFHKANK